MTLTENNICATVAVLHYIVVLLLHKSKNSIIPSLFKTDENSFLQLAAFVKTYEPKQIIDVLNKAKGVYEYNAYTQQRQNQIVLDIVLTQLH